MGDGICNSADCIFFILSSVSLMAGSGNSNSSSLKVFSQRGSYVNLKAKLRNAEITEFVLMRTIKSAFGIETKTFGLVFDEVEEGGPLHQCGIRTGDELTTVNYASVNSSHDVNHIASVIRDCSPKFMLGIRRARGIGYVPVMVLFELGDADSNPVQKFCGFYWNVSPQDIPFIPLSFKSIETYNFQNALENVEVIGKKDNAQHWLTFKNNEWTFETIRSTSSNFVLYVYTLALVGNPLPTDTPVILVPQYKQSCALDATINDEIETSPFSSTYFRGKKIPGSGLFLKVFGVDDNTYHIKSSKTESYLAIANVSGGTQVPIMSSNPTAISLHNSTTGEHVSF